MALRFLGVDPATKDNGSPAMFLDDETGDLLFQGWVETDPATLTLAASYSRMAPNEKLVRLPARMRPVIEEALDAARTSVR